jgi:hypothetical protein
MYKVTAIIDNIKKLSNSKNGNPAYEVTYDAGNGAMVVRTATDAGFAYAITPRWIGHRCEISINGVTRKKISDMVLVDLI